jgi:hypothetical protein
MAAARVTRIMCARKSGCRARLPPLCRLVRGLCGENLAASRAGASGGRVLAAALAPRAGICDYPKQPALLAGAAGESACFYLYLYLLFLLIYLLSSCLAQGDAPARQRRGVGPRGAARPGRGRRGRAGAPGRRAGLPGAAAHRRVPGARAAAGRRGARARGPHAGHGHRARGRGRAPAAPPPPPPLARRLRVRRLPAALR